MLKDWKEKKIKYIFTLINGGTPKSNIREYWDKEEVVWFTPEDLSATGTVIRESKRRISKLGLKESSAQLVKKDSIILSTRAPIGNVKISAVPFATNQGCKSLELKEKENDIRFFYYWFYAHKDYLNHLGRGTTFLELPNHALKNIKVKRPPYKSQESISDFLDKKMFEVDSLVQNKEKLIELLEEKRQAVITETVTKGLDPNVKMKDSGIDWIGEIPEHWEIIKLKHLFKIKNGGTPKSNNPNYWSDSRDSGIIWITPEDLSTPGYEISNSKRKISYEGLRNSSATMIEAGSIVISSRAPIGNIKYATKRFATNQGCKSLQKSKVKINQLYYFYLLRVFKKELQVLGEGTTFLELSHRNLANYEVPLLPHLEMNKIVRKVTKTNIYVDSLIESQKKIINLLKEYRESLIYEAVTGKIDLRDYECDEEISEV